jgi:hypothetical protein
MPKPVVHKYEVVERTEIACHPRHETSSILVTPLEHNVTCKNCLRIMAARKKRSKNNGK